MKCFLFCLILLGLFPCLANENDEQVLTTGNKNCAIHYLSSKAKKLYSIEVDESYCHGGWVQGFTSVIVKDALGRTATTLNGFFHQGYWLSDFPGPIDAFERYTPKQGIQDFIFKIQSAQEPSTDFYMVARSTQNKDEYGSFQICPQNPLLLAVHEPATDFGLSLFQTQLLKEGQALLKEKCPNATKFDLIGGSKQILMEEDGPFHASIDTASEETTLSYVSPIPLKEKLKPTELRHESAEKLITIHPEPPPVSSETPEETPSVPTEKIIELPQQQSAIDMALMAHVLQTPIQGTVIVYIDTEANSSPIVTRPIRLTLQTTQNLSKGWHIVTGVFHAQSEKTILHILWAKPCLKEWCTDEN